MLDFDDETKLATKETLVREGAAKRDRACLIVLQGLNVGEVYPLEKAEVLIGRGQGVDIQILDEGMSRRHAAVRRVGETISVHDLGSRNGTFANGSRIETHVLADGDKILVGTQTILKFAFQDALDESFTQKMYEQALRDPLTRAYNKRFFLERLDAEFKFAVRHVMPLSLLLFDIDFFKKINDGHGHLAGDAILVQLADLVHAQIRAEDLFARYGGEEFAIICRGIDNDGAALFAERLRLAVEAQRFEHDGRVLPVTISMGVAGVPSAAIVEPTGLIASADEALYAAKRGGRNRVRLAG